MFRFSLSGISPFWWIYTTLLCGSCAALGVAWVMEFGFDIKPCFLCLWQRVPYYAAIILLMTYGVLAFFRPRIHAPTFKRWVLAVMALLFTLGALLALYHAGIEWHFWTQAETCSEKGPILDFHRWRQELEHATVAQCDEAAFRFMGLSPAGWNGLLSIGFAALSSYGAWYKRS